MNFKNIGLHCHSSIRYSVYTQTDSQEHEKCCLFVADWETVKGFKVSISLRLLFVLIYALNPLSKGSMNWSNSDSKMHYYLKFEGCTLWNIVW